MKKKADELLELLQQEVERFNELGITPIKKLSGILNAVRLAINDLKAGLAGHKFKDPAEEIEFFKYGKPKIIAEQFYAVEIFTVETNRPIGDELHLKMYYEQELKIVRRFFDQYRFLYQYYLMDGTELDNCYFLRSAEVPGGLLPENPDRDPAFSAPADYLFARFIAYERLKEYLISCLYHRKEEESTLVKPKRKPFRWTGDKSNLVEIAYGLYGTLQINEGKATIAEIIEWLEESFDINLNRYYRRFSEIKMRKSISQSKYLDEMRAAFLKYIEDGDVWKPGRRE